MITSSVTGTSPPSRGSCCRLLSRSSSRSLQVTRKRRRKSGQYRASWRLATSWAVTRTRCCTPATPTSRSHPATGSTPCRPTGTVTLCSGMYRQSRNNKFEIYLLVICSIYPNYSKRGLHPKTPAHCHVLYLCEV